VIGDEINRASAKTQSAMLECMEERQVTVDQTYALEAPFMVIATQNPLEMEGTYAMPEAQRDRFLARVSMGYPVEAAEIAMLAARDNASPLEELEPVTDGGTIRKLVGVGQRGTRLHRRASVRPSRWRPPPVGPRDLRLGASPRATLHPDPRGQGTCGDLWTRVRDPGRRPRTGAHGAGAPAAADHRSSDERAQGAATSLPAHRHGPRPQ